MQPCVIKKKKNTSQRIYRQIIRMNNNSTAAKAKKQRTQEMQVKRDRNTQEVENLNSLLLVHARSSR